MVHENLTRLLVFGEVPTLIETTTARAVHPELWRPRQLNDETSRTLRCALGSSLYVSLLQSDVLDPGEWIFDLVAGGIVVDIVCDASLVGGVEDDQVHCALPDSTPGANGQ